MGREIEERGKSPAFQFYVNDWLSSTHVMLMTPAQEGGYIHLLAIMWNDPTCSLPNDDQTLAKLSRLNEGWFNGDGTVVRGCFEISGNRLVNVRLLKERKKQQLWREKSKQGGIKSGKSRRDKGLDTKGWLKGGCDLVEPKGNSSSSSSSSSSFKESITDNTLVGSSKSEHSNDSQKRTFESYPTEFRELTLLLADNVLSHNPKNRELRDAKKQETLARWIRDIEKLHRIDKQTIEDIAAVIVFSQTEQVGKEFQWYRNILSGATLRKQWDKLYMQTISQKQRKGIHSTDY